MANVKVNTKDIESVGEKLNAFAKKLPPGEQNVLAWLMSRAAEAPPATGTLVKKIEGAKVQTAPGTTTAGKLSPSQQLGRSLGVAQFSKMRPGSLAAGSGVGITATIMF
ncbi:MAG: hypothetical protein WAQ99_09420 [Pyrinomonadaceae bacterium]